MGGPVRRRRAGRCAWEARGRRRSGRLPPPDDGSNRSPAGLVKRPWGDTPVRPGHARPDMKLVVAGGGGFLGRPLCETCAEDGHEVVMLTRGLPPGESEHEAGTGVPGVTRLGWSPDGQIGPWAGALEEADAVVNLAGESIGARRWSAARKRALRDSRVLATRSLVVGHPGAAPPAARVRQRVRRQLLRVRGPVREDRANRRRGSDFLAALCVEWEEEAARARRPETRVVTLRTGLALERSGGALPAARAAVPAVRRRHDRLRAAGRCRGSTGGTGSSWCAGRSRRATSTGRSTPPRPRR